VTHRNVGLGGGGNFSHTQICKSVRGKGKRLGHEEHGIWTITSSDSSYEKTVFGGPRKGPSRNSLFFFRCRGMTLLMNTTLWLVSLLLCSSFFSGLARQNLHAPHLKTTKQVPSDLLIRTILTEFFKDTNGAYAHPPLFISFFSYIQLWGQQACNGFEMINGEPLLITAHGSGLDAPMGLFHLSLWVPIT